MVAANLNVAPDPSTNGDINEDGKVDSADLNLLLSDFNTPPNALDQVNLEVLLTNFGRTDMAASNPVPEPHTALLITMGMIGMAMCCRKRRRVAPFGSVNNE